MRLDVQCRLSFIAQFETPAILMLRPRSGWGQWVVREEYLLQPNISVVEYTDSFGNLCQRIVIPPGPFDICASASVETADSIDVQSDAPFIPVSELPVDVLQFLLPSRYCQADQPQIGSLAAKIVAGLKPSYAQVEAIRNWIQENIRYEYGTSNASTSALETANQRVGVCRDFAHLGIALCRSLNIPARMVVGYLHELDPMDLHAWFEAYVGDQWYTFDATQKQPKGNRVAIAYGRDAADVALITQFGPMELTQMEVTVSPGTAPELEALELEPLELESLELDSLELKSLDLDSSDLQLQDLELQGLEPQAV
ncbi:MAG: transglutaminase family protein [Thermosynechococcaceae cyanobacterium MS004]|nr:transglutaminase family protein [Thermosynechococcaceae cyanobacterium MS004]